MLGILYKIYGWVYYTEKIGQASPTSMGKAPKNMGEVAIIVVIVQLAGFLATSPEKVVKYIAKNMVNIARNVGNTTRNPGALAENVGELTKQLGDSGACQSFGNPSQKKQ